MSKTSLDASIFYLPPSASSCTAAFSSAPSSSSSSPRSPHSPHFIDQLALERFQGLCDFNPIAHERKPKKKAGRKEGRREELTLLLKRTQELFNFFAPKDPLNGNCRSLELESVKKQSFPSPSSYSDKVFAYEYCLEKRTLERIEQARFLESHGCPMISKDLELLKELVAKNRQRLSLRKDTVLTVTPGKWNGTPIAILYSLNKEKETIRFYFPRSGCQGGSKKVTSLWTLSPPNKQALLMADAYSQETTNELSYLLTLQGRCHTVALQETFKDPMMRFFIQPYYPSTLMESLNEITTTRYYHERAAYSDTQKIQIARQLLNAVSFLHSQNIVHRDIKPENVLRDPDSNQIVLCDFGYACESDDSKEADKNPGTRIYAAPECIEGKGSSKASDVWGVSLLLWVIFSEELPGWLPPLMQDPMDYDGALRQMRSFFQKLATLSSPDPLQKLFLSAFNLDPKKRPKIFDLKHELEKIFNTSSTLTLYERSQEIK